jgi:hypothetical protein
MAASPKMIGEYLTAEKKITPEQLQKALQLQANSIQSGRMPLIGTVLVQMGALNDQDLAFALEAQERDRMRVSA